MFYNNYEDRLSPELLSIDGTGSCFFCGRETMLIDINYEAFYCGLDDEEIYKDLLRLAKEGEENEPRDNSETLEGLG